MNLNKDTILKELSKINDYSIAKESYSPFYSNIGFVMKNDTEGLGQLHIHYNRKNRKVWDNTVKFPLSLNKNESLVNLLVFGEGEKKAELAFFDTDAFMFGSKGLENVELLRDLTEDVADYWCDFFSKNSLLIRGLSKNGDGRDPDNFVPFAVNINMLKGTLTKKKGQVTALADENGEILFSFIFKVLEVSQDDIKATLKKAPKTVCEAAKICEDDIISCVENLNIPDVSEAELSILSRAIHGLIFNLTKAPGFLKNNISSYPNRATYPTHFLWDSCFQNLAYEHFAPQLAKESLMQLINNQRVDGKIIHFLCSTWMRPHHSQPPLVGWAGLRLYKQTGDKKFLKTLFTSMERNNLWWLTQRMTHYGVISCNDGLETGQDDSPRFDNGPTLACDMNSYLLRQLYVTSEIASILGLTSKAKKWEKEADNFGKQMMKVLYNKEDNLFYDVHIESGKQIKMLTPCSVMPIWAGIKMNEEKKQAMIKDYLLNPTYLFGDIPFPSVAYTEETYLAGKWWRGSTWLSESWIMLDLLLENGYEKEWEEAIKRFYYMLLKDPHMHELFNSQTGEGLGSEEQGWTCAIFIKICLIMRERNLL